MEQTPQPNINSPFGNPPSNPVPVQTPIQPVQPSQAPLQQPVQPEQKKSNAWKWLLGGCLSLVVIVIIAFMALGWWGARKVKNEIKKYEPNIEEMKNKLDQMNTEGEEWQKKSEEFRNSLPNPEDIQNEMPSLK